MRKKISLLATVARSSCLPVDFTSRTGGAIGSAAGHAAQRLEDFAGGFAGDLERRSTGPNGTVAGRRKCGDRYSRIPSPWFDNRRLEDPARAPDIYSRAAFTPGS